MIEHSYFFHHKMIYAWFFAMHTRVDIVLCDVEEGEGRALCEEIYYELNFWEMIASRFHEGSELYQLNQRMEKDQGAFPVSSALYRLLREGLRYTFKTNRLFDITFRSTAYDAETLSQVKLTRDEIWTSCPGIHFDLSGFAKGFALDQCVDIVLKGGVEHALLNLGNSSIIGIGNHPCGEGWPVATAYDSEGGDEYSFIIKDEALTTSGYSDAYEAHIIDPMTGEFARGKRYVSVITDSAAEGEAFSTALFVCESRVQMEKLSACVKNVKITL